MVQRDYIMRLIEQFLDAIARIVAHLTGDRLDQAESEIEVAYRMLGLTSSMAKSLDDASLAVVVGPEKTDLVMKLFEVEATLLRKRGKEKSAAALEARVAAYRTPI